MARLLLFVFSFLFAPLLLGAQCPTVRDLSQQLSQREDLPVVDACPGFLDSASISLHALSVTHWTEGNVNQAIRFALRAVEVQEKLYQGKRPQLPLGKSFHNLGMFHKKKGDLNAAANYFYRADRTFTRVVNPDAHRRRVNSAIQAGYLYSVLGDFDRSRRVLKSIVDNPESLAFPAIRARAFIILGDLAIESENYQGAISYLREAIASHERDDNQVEIRAAKVSLANASYKLRRYAAAADLLTPILPDLEGEQLSRALSLASLIAGRQGNYLDAEALHLQNLEVAQTIEYPLYIAQAFDNGAEIALLDQQPRLALERVAQALASLMAGYDPADAFTVPTRAQLQSSPYKVDLVIYLQDLARMLEANQEKEEALAALEAAASVTDDIRSGLGGSVSKLFWRNQVKPIYERAIAICLETEQPQRAFAYFEKSRAILLYESLLEADTRAMLPDSIREKLTALAARVNDSEAKLTGGETTLEEGQKRITEARDSFLAYRQQVAVLYPNTLIASTDVETISLAQARELLASQGIGVSIQYFFGKEQVYAFSVTAADEQLYALGEAKPMEEEIREWLEYFSAPGKINEDYNGFLPRAQSLEKQLIAPFIQQAGQRVLLVPDGILAYLSFAALVRGEGFEDVTQADYLITVATLLHAQSLTVLKHQVASERLGKGTIVGFAPYSESNPSGQPILIASALEIQCIEQALEGEIYLGQEADKKTILSKFEEADVVHLATHAFASRTNEEPPRILAANAPLYLPEIYGMRCDQELVTLSACNSNLGEEVAEEGVFSLGRAFTAAGAAAVVASLWALNDQATADITTTFYWELSRGIDKATALRNAQLAYLNDPEKPGYLRNPVYWSALTLYGAPGQLAATKKGLFYWVSVGIIVILGISLLWWMWPRKGPSARY